MTEKQTNTPARRAREKQEAKENVKQNYENELKDTHGRESRRKSPINNVSSYEGPETGRLKRPTNSDPVEKS